jgi:hypothetical protein
MIVIWSDFIDPELIRSDPPPATPYEPVLTSRRSNPPSPSPSKQYDYYIRRMIKKARGNTHPPFSGVSFR